jgi:peptide-methionine (S)-S-oxide reductase
MRGGMVADPSYEQVCAGRASRGGQVEYDPATVRYEQLLEVFWTNHDPTPLHWQGPDVGIQQRPVIFYHNQAEAQPARQRRRSRHPGAMVAPSFTEVAPFATLHPAEEYRERYLEKRRPATRALP